MEFKEKLKVIRDMWSISVSENRDYEFDADFEDHEIGDSNVYRLHYVSYHRFGENYGMGPNNSSKVDYSYKPFMLPEKMSREDAFKVLSYLTDYIERQLEVKECSNRSVSELDKVLDLDALGFKRVKLNVGDDTDIIELFTVTGRLLLFKNSKYYSQYFEWYHENVTFEEVVGIYERCGMHFSDLKLEERCDDTKKRCLN